MCWGDLAARPAEERLRDLPRLRWQRLRLPVTVQAHTRQEILVPCLQGKKRGQKAGVGDSAAETADVFRVSIKSYVFGVFCVILCFPSGLKLIFLIEYFPSGVNNVFWLFSFSLLSGVWTMAPMAVASQTDPTLFLKVCLAGHPPAVMFPS